MNKKLKLTKLTVSNLDRAKGGRPPQVCACDYVLQNGQYNYDNWTNAITICIPICPGEG